MVFLETETLIHCDVSFFGTSGWPSAHSDKVTFAYPPGLGARTHRLQQRDRCTFLSALSLYTIFLALRLLCCTVSVVRCGQGTICWQLLAISKRKSTGVDRALVFHTKELFCTRTDRQANQGITLCHQDWPVPESTLVQGSGQLQQRTANRAFDNHAWLELLILDTVSSKLPQLIAEATRLSKHTLPARLQRPAIQERLTDQQLIRQAL